jgi:tRNA dimethylallyltransferase
MREKLEAQADLEGMEAMLSLLHSIDPEAAARLHLKDRKRIIRALEVYYETGETITEHNRKTQAIPPKYTPLWLGLDFDPRAALYDRIDRRVDLMLEAGLVEEIQHLLSQGIPARCTAMQAIGYKEFIDAMDGKISIAEAADQVRQSSRHYAKRQLTWFRRNPAIHWLRRKPGMGNEEILLQARQILQENDK